MEAVILVGHGGVPADFPKGDLAELKRLEGERQSRGGRELSSREVELDQKIRSWPRTLRTDPYKFGLEALAEKLKPLLPGKRLVVAYNEFCAPSLESAIDALVREGSSSIDVVTTMLTPGGYHAEMEIPQVVEAKKKEHAGVAITYLWPYNLNRVAELFAAQVQLAGRVRSGAG